MKTLTCPIATFANDAPFATALLDDNTAYSAKELDQLVQGACRELLIKGINANSRVAFHGLKNTSAVILFFALMRLGAIACPLNTRNPKVNLDGLDATYIDVETFPLYAGDYHDSLIDQNQISTLLHTSGSTGFPKIAALTFGNFYYNALGAIDSLLLSFQDRWLLSLPLFHVGGLSILFRCFIAKATIVIGNSPSCVTHLSLVPTQLYRYLKNEDTFSAKCILLGGAPISRSLVEMSKTRGLNVFHSYGMTEMASLIALSSGNNLHYRELKPALDGEVLVRGKTLFKGYWDKEKGIDLPLDEEGWFKTSDIGQWEGGKLISLKGRKDNLFISGGENIQPEEIEKALARIPGVITAVVVPIPDDEFGYKPAAFIEGNCTLHIIQEALLPYLPKYKIPKYLFPLPLLASDKPQRKELTRLAQESVRVLKGSQE